MSELEGAPNQPVFLDRIFLVILHALLLFPGLLWQHLTFLSIQSYLKLDLIVLRTLLALGHPQDKVLAPNTKPFTFCSWLSQQTSYLPKHCMQPMIFYTELFVILISIHYTFNFLNSQMLFFTISDFCLANSHSYFKAKPSQCHLCVTGKMYLFCKFISRPKRMKIPCPPQCLILLSDPRPGAFTPWLCTWLSGPGVGSDCWLTLFAFVYNSQGLQTIP